MSLYKQYFNDILDEVSKEQAAKAVKAGEDKINALVLKNRSKDFTTKHVKRGVKILDAILGLEDEMERKKPKLPEAYPWGGFDATTDDFDGEKERFSTASEDPKDLAVSATRISDILERNIPTSPDKWAKAKAAARSKFKVYPSAYANLWAAKKYKSMGGGWKKGKK